MQSLAKSIRKYMKSYLPQLDSSTILLSIAWSTLFGMFRNIIFCLLVYHHLKESISTHRGPNVNALPNAIDVHVVMMTSSVVVR